ncbi:hypothetical protein [Amycolatopsis japonica]
MNAQRGFAAARITGDEFEQVWRQALGGQ